MHDDILYEENAATERIVVAYGEPNHSDSDTNSYDSDPDGYANADVARIDDEHPLTSSFPRLPEVTDDDINENTDTEDGSEDVIELLGANSRLIAWVAQQTATMVRLRNGTEEVVELLDANTQLVAMVAKQRETMARLRARITRLLSFITQLTSF